MIPSFEILSELFRSSERAPNVSITFRFANFTTFRRTKVRHVVFIFLVSRSSLVPLFRSRRCESRRDSVSFDRVSDNRSTDRSRRSIRPVCPWRAPGAICVNSFRIGAIPRLCDYSKTRARRLHTILRNRSYSATTRLTTRIPDLCKSNRKTKRETRRMSERDREVVCVNVCVRLCASCVRACVRAIGKQKDRVRERNLYVFA